MKLFPRVKLLLPLWLALLAGCGAQAAVDFTALNSFRGTNGAQPFGQLLRATNGLFYGTTATGGANGLGTIFSATTGGAITTAVSFNGTNGAQPLAGLIQGIDGNFYGTASSGGAYGKGTAFLAAPDGGLTNLFSFDGTNGARPIAPLMLGMDGNFYGTTSAGGLFDLGTIFRITPDGAVTLLFSFAGTNGSQPAGALVQVADGTLYGTAPAGGAFGYGTVFSFSPAGVFTNIYSFTGGRDGAGPQAGLTRASDGNFYGTTATGGTNAAGQGAGTVFVINPGFFFSRHAFIGTDGANPSCSLVQGMNGVLYGTTAAGGSQNKGTIFSVKLNGTLTNLYSFTGTGGSGPIAGLTPGTNGSFFGVAPSGGKSRLGTFFELSGIGPFIIVPPTPVTATAGDTVVLTVLAGGSAPLDYRWQFNSNNLVNSAKISGVTTPNLMLSDIRPTQAGMYSVSVKNSAGQIVSANTRVNVISRPGISITSPEKNALVQSSFLAIAGLTSGDVAVARVYYQLNDGGWQLATTSDNWMHWRAKVTLPPGTNRLDAYAESILGTFSNTNSVGFNCAVTSAPVVVQINGDGVVTPNLDGHLLQLGRMYSMTAVPSTSSLFAGWSGDLMTNAARVVFVMESNLVLQANFVPNPFLPARGTYSGLFRPAAGISHTNSGFLSLNLTSQGAFSGRLQLGASRYSLSGRFDMDGNSQFMIPRGSLTPLTLVVQLNLDGGSGPDCRHSQRWHLACSANR